MVKTSDLTAFQKCLDCQYLLTSPHHGFCDGAQEKESKPTEQNQVLDEKEKKEQRVQFGRLVNELKKIEKKDEYKKMDYFLEEFSKIRDMGRPKLQSSKSIPS